MTSPALISTRREFFSLWNVYWPIAAGVFVLVLVVTLFALIRYHRRPDAATWHKHTPLEGGYALLLLLTTVFLLYLTFLHEHRVDTVANRERPSLVINVTASRWEWRFAYPAYGITRFSGMVGNQSLVVPTNQAIRFNLTSQDVVHGFWIPALEFKRDVFAGATESVVLTFTQAGFFPSHCSVFCGLRHPEMLFNARALPPAAFAAWVRSQTHGARS